MCDLRLGSRLGSRPSGEQAAMKKPPFDQPSGAPQASDGLYDRHAPIPVAEAHESDTESVWALFHESSLPPEELALVEAGRAKEPAATDAGSDPDATPTVAAPMADPNEHDNGFAETSFAQTGFSDAHFDLTIPSPLKSS